MWLSENNPVYPASSDQLDARIAQNIAMIATCIQYALSCGAYNSQKSARAATT